MNKTILSARLVFALTIAATFDILIATVASAAGPSRLFSCPSARVINIIVTGPNTIIAEPIDGAPMKMDRDPNNALRYFKEDYTVTLTADQGALKLEIPDWGSATCRYGSKNVKEFLPRR